MALLLWTDGETGGPGTTLMAVAWTKTVVYLGYDCGVVAQLAEERVREVEAGDLASLSRLVRVWVICVVFLPSKTRCWRCIVWLHTHTVCILWW